MSEASLGVKLWAGQTQYVRVCQRYGGCGHDAGYVVRWYFRSKACRLFVCATHVDAQRVACGPKAVVTLLHETQETPWKRSLEKIRRRRQQAGGVRDLGFAIYGREAVLLVCDDV